MNILSCKQQIYSTWETDKRVAKYLLVTKKLLLVSQKLERSSSVCKEYEQIYLYKSQTIPRAFLRSNILPSNP